MLLLLLSFVSGVLTVLAPCVLPLLPVIIGGSLQGKAARNPFVITASLVISLMAFTLLLKVSTVFIHVPEAFWSGLSGGIIIVLGVLMIFPRLWEMVNVKLHLSSSSDKMLETSAKKRGFWGDILLGAALGPVFSSCSPTYVLILATVLPVSIVKGFGYLLVYSIGLAIALLALSLVGQKLIARVKWAANPTGIFRRGLGVLFVVVGALIAFGLTARLQTAFLDSGFNITRVEQDILEKTFDMPNESETGQESYHEIAKPSGFVNTDGEPITIGQFVGKKVVLVDFMTYSCINCIRTFPYLNDWYAKYKDQGLVIIGIHTPEFAFEHELSNVEAAMKKYGIEFPVVLDNDYGTWRAYKNQYWPRKYLIDLEGRIVYDHIGEGEYEETEQKIRELLGLDGEVEALPSEEAPKVALSPETYFGAARNTLLANGTPKTIGVQSFVVPSPIVPNTLVLDGSWNITKEYAENTDARARIVYGYQAGDVFFVASSDKPARMEVRLDNGNLPKELAGDDVVFEGEKAFVTISDERLYSLISGTFDGVAHGLELILQDPHVRAYTFTFGA